MSLRDDALKLHRDHVGKPEIRSKVLVNNEESLSLASTPGVASWAWNRQRHQKRTRINWTFTRRKARKTFRYGVSRQSTISADRGTRNASRPARRLRG